MRAVLVIAWIFFLLVASGGCYALVSGLAEANSAPQQSAVALIALCVVVIPYCVWKSLSDLMIHLSDERREDRETGKPKD